MNTGHRFTLLLLLPAVLAVTACDSADESVDFDESVRSSELAGWPPQKIAPTEDLVIGWVRWASSLPWHDGPISDTTGEHCAEGQDGPVWYLAGTSGGPAVRECDIPAGKQLFFPLVNLWCVFPVEFYPDEAAMQDALPWFADFFDYLDETTCSLTLRIDGQELLDYETMHEELQISVLEPFEVEVTDEHWAQGVFEGGVMPGIATGHYVHLPPLTPGDHTIELGGEFCGDVAMSTSVTYLLHVGP